LIASLVKRKNATIRLAKAEVEWALDPLPWPTKTFRFGTFDDHHARNAVILSNRISQALCGTM